MSGFRCVAANTSDTHPTLSARRTWRLEDTILVQLSINDTGQTVVNVFATHPDNIRINLNTQEHQP
ncbi:hypothetical protein [Mycobacterium sp. 1245801.1]|uniref:hypothetical protein n=1 Tax=Mycobacterium sp. 1245801.1 TaxID=1834075 RepID=UPI0008003420|nr:hypothetical protein [Mycobacterium sp. 1245801.1]OBJ15570.1 hypothetical protein A5622_26625 [Mycobacterium sp. 1245801.1]